MPPNRFESEVESFLEGSHGDRTHIKRADHHTVTPLCGTLLRKMAQNWRFVACWANFFAKTPLEGLSWAKFFAVEPVKAPRRANFVVVEHEGARCWANFFAEMPLEGP